MQNYLMRIANIIAHIPDEDYADGTTTAKDMARAYRNLESTGNTAHIRQAMAGMKNQANAPAKSYWYVAMPEILDKIDDIMKRGEPTLAEKIKVLMDKQVSTSMAGSKYTEGYHDACLDIMELLGINQDAANV